MLEYDIFWILVDYYRFVEVLRNFYEIRFEESKGKIDFALFRVEIKK